MDGAAERAETHGQVLTGDRAILLEALLAARERLTELHRKVRSDLIGSHVDISSPAWTTVENEIAELPWSSALTGTYLGPPGVASGGADQVVRGIATTGRSNCAYARMSAIAIPKPVKAGMSMVLADALAAKLTGHASVLVSFYEHQTFSDLQVRGLLRVQGRPSVHLHRPAGDTTASSR